MDLIDAFDAMEATLRHRDVDAPRRQLAGVRAWRADTAVAVRLAAAFRNPRGVRIPDRVMSGRRWVPNPGLSFIYGDETHRAWADMCRAALAAITRQQHHAAGLHEHFKAIACSTSDPGMGDAATVLARRAAQWWGAAVAAGRRGLILLQKENSISTPIGQAIASAGGIREVAREKTYHQAGAG